jgi:hypothetical protein
VSSSRDTERSRGPQTPGATGRATPAAMVAAEARVADALGVEIEDLAGWGEGRVSVLKEDQRDAVAALRQLLQADASPETALVMSALFEGSYQTQLVHGLLRDIADRLYVEWLAGRRDNPMRIVLGVLPQRFKFGVTSEDYDLVMRFADEPTLALDEQGHKDSEDLRAYWFDSFKRLRDPRVYEFCRSILSADLDSWCDYRAADALRELGRLKDPADKDLVVRFATSHPDPWVRNLAKRTRSKYE